MKYNIELTKEAQNEFQNLTIEQQALLIEDYRIINEEGMEYVLTRPIEDKVFEIKTKNLRSLFIYKENQIIIIGLIYEKQTQKIPKNTKKQALKRLKNI